jgi:hypothetical protein
MKTQDRYSKKAIIYPGFFYLYSPKNWTKLLQSNLIGGLMALDKAIKDALKDVNADIVSKIEKLNETAEATEKVRDANKDLTTQRTEWEKKEKDYKSKITNFESEKTKFEDSIKEKDTKISTLEKEKLSPEDLVKLKENDDLKAKLNAITETVSNLEKENKESKRKQEESDKKAAQATRNAAIEAQKIKVQKELIKNNVIDTDKGMSNTLALHALSALGHYKVDVDEGGKVIEKYYTKNSNNELAESDLASIVKDFAEKNPSSVSASGNNGTGENHNRSRYSSNSEPKTLQEQGAVADKLLNMK